jgi:hypothetical protein
LPWLVHTAAWRLGERAPRVPAAVAARLAAAQEQAILELARRSQGAELVVVTGDLLADNQVGAGTIALARRLLEAFAPTPVHVLPGARDAAEAGGALRRLGAGQGELRHVQVHLGAEPVQVGPYWVQPCPLLVRRPLRDPTEAIGAPPAGTIGLVLAHGRAGQARVDEDVLHHVDAERLLGLGWRLVLLGGNSDGAQLDGGVLYAGSPEVVGPGREGLGSAWRVELDGEGARCVRLVVGTRGWRTDRVQLDDDAAIEALQTSLDAVEDGPRMVVELSLRGALSPVGHRRLEAVLRSAAERFAHLEVEEQLDVRLGEHDLAGARGVLADAVEALISTGEPVGRRAAMLLLHALEPS